MKKSFDIHITPYWKNTISRVLNIVCYKTSVYQFDVKITGPGIKDASPIEFNNSTISGVQSITVPSDAPSTLKYKVEITTNSDSLDGQVQNSLEIGTKPNGEAMTYQGTLFTNDSGSDNDWNDCVVNLALYNQSTD